MNVRSLFIRSSAVGALLLASAAWAQVAPGPLELISQSTAGEPGNQESVLASVSADGRYVAFTSLADNLVPGDTNLSSDIFVRDRLLGITTRVSVTSRGRQGEGNSGFLNGLGGPSISGDGRYVAFDSEAQLSGDDRNEFGDVYVHDRFTGETRMITASPDGNRFGGGGTEPSISRDGRFVAFSSFADSFVPDNNFTSDIFVADLSTGAIERISQAPDGSDANSSSFGPPKISADGRWIYFTSFASNLVPNDTDTGSVDAYLFDRQTQTMFAITSQLGTPEGNFVTNHGSATGLSGDGRYMTFSTDDATIGVPDDNGFNTDAWRHDHLLGTNERYGVNSAEQQADELTFGGPVSDDGNLLAFVSRGTNLGGPTQFRENVYLRNRSAGTTLLVSAASDGTFGDLNSINPAMTPDGLAIAFQSNSSNFIPGGSFTQHIYLRDMRPSADLNVTLTDSPDPVAERAALTYTITIRNDGPGTASGVIATGVLPAITFNSATPSTGSCTRAGKGKVDGTITCSLGTLAPNATATVTIVGTPTRAGTISAIASVVANEPDSDPDDNSDTETTTVTPR